MVSEPLSQSGAGTEGGTPVLPPAALAQCFPPSVETCAVSFAVHTTALADSARQSGDSRGEEIRTAPGSPRTASRTIFHHTLRLRVVRFLSLRFCAPVLSSVNASDGGEIAPTAFCLASTYLFWCYCCSCRMLV